MNEDIELVESYAGITRDDLMLMHRRQQRTILELQEELKILKNLYELATNGD